MCRAALSSRRSEARSGASRRRRSPRAFRRRMESRWCSISPPRRWRKARCWWPRTAATPFRPRASSSLTDGSALTRARSTARLRAGSPRDARNGAGAIRAFGEHKGSGLALLCELLAGALTGSGCCGPGPRRFCNGMLSIYMAPAFFTSPDTFAAEMRAYLEFVKSARPAALGGEVLLPGEPERRTRAQRLAEGVPLSEEIWASLSAAGVEHGLDGRAFAETTTT